MQTENNSNATVSPNIRNYVVQEAVSIEQLDAVYRLRYKVFVEEDKKFTKAEHANDMLYDKYDTYKETVNLIVSNGKEYIGTIRATIAANGEQYLPCDQYYEGYKKMRSKQTGRYSSVGMLAISKKNCSVKLLYTLIKVSLQIGSDHHVDYAFFPVNHKMQKTLERLGAVLVGEVSYNEHVGNFIAPMMLEVKKMAQRFGIKGYYLQ